MNLRPYQREAIDYVNAYLAECDDHGVVSLPTAAGKTIIFAAMIRDWLLRWPTTRICILAHRQELLTQAEAKLKAIWPDAPIGVWSAGLGRKEGAQNILIGGIQSIYKRACDFDPFDIVIVDEAHLTPNSDDTMYRRFLADAKLCNPNLRIVGFTATPYRLDGGPLCGEGKLFTHIIYEAPIRNLIDDGYLCTLRTKATDAVIDTHGVHTRKGDFVQSELEARANTDELVEAAVAEIVKKGEGRKAWLIFCSGVNHAQHVSDVLATHCINAPVVIGETNKDERSGILADFDAGKINAVVNVNCLTTGLDVTRIDLIAVLRPTQSTSLWVQMVGRGFRLHPNKSDCLILDFGQNCYRHGPLDNLKIKTKRDGEGEAPVKVCPECDEMVHAAMLVCPCCGYEFPPREIKHETKAAVADILSPSEPWEDDVESVGVKIHSKAGKPDSLQVTYHCKGIGSSYREWVCFEHDGYASAKAHQWWKRRFDTPVPATAKEAIDSDLFLAATLASITKRVKVRQVGKYPEIINVTLCKDALAVQER